MLYDILKKYRKDLLNSNLDNPIIDDNCVINRISTTKYQISGYKGYQPLYINFATILVIK